MADDLDGLARSMSRLGDGLDRLPRTSGHAVGRIGKDAVLDLARKVFGSDRKFSGAKNSRKAKRVATAKYSIVSDTAVEIYPSGDPFYIFMKGRGRHVIRPRKGKGGLAFSDGEVRRSVIGGRLAPREDLLDPAVKQIGREAPKAVDKALQDTIRRALV